MGTGVQLNVPFAEQYASMPVRKARREVYPDVRPQLVHCDPLGLDPPAPPDKRPRFPPAFTRALPMNAFS